MSARATEGALDGLHAKVAEVLTNALKGTGADAPSPQMIAQAIKFLAVNGINSPATSKRLTDLADALKDLDLDDAAASLPN